MSDEAAQGLHADLHVAVPTVISGTLRCDTGKMVAIVGPSGAGKSTLLRVLAGLIPSASVVKVDDDWSSRPTHRRQVGYVSQQFNLLPHLSAVENIAMGIPAAQKIALAEARDWLDRVGLSGLESRRSSGLSGGQQQRVALARALARKPKLLLLDEPFSSVDAATRQRLYEALLSLRKSIRCPTVLVTHDVKEAAMLADDIAVLSEGKILAQDSAPTMLTTPPSAQVARVLGWRNVIPLQRFAGVAAFAALLPEEFRVGPRADTSAKACSVLVAHRAVLIDVRGTVDCVGRVRTVLALPHQSFAHVQVGEVHIWGTVAIGCRLSEGDECMIMVPKSACRIVPDTSTNFGNA